MPLAMSNANFTAWLWSTTRAADDGSKGGRRQTEDLIPVSQDLNLNAFVDIVLITY